MEPVEVKEEGKIRRVKNKIKKLPRWLKVALGILIPVLIIGMMVSSKEGTAGMAVQTGEVAKRTIEQSVITNGRLESANKQEFFTPVDSTLMELEVEVGDKVKKGQVLGRLDTMELGRQYEEAKAKLAQKEAELAAAMAVSDQLELASARAQYEKEKNNYERISYLYQEGAVTPGELETAKMNLARAEAAYHEAKVKAEHNASDKKVTALRAQVDLAKQESAQAEERLNLATFVAEDDGVVLFVGAEKGNRVLEGSRILVVGSSKELEVTAKVNEVDAGNLEVGQPVTVTCSTLPGREFKGEVTRVSAAALSDGSNNNISVPVTVKLKKDIEGLKPGYTVDLKIITMEKQEFLTVPFEAVVTRDNEKVVFVVDNGKAEKRRVETRKGNELFEIVEKGLKEGEKVILSPPPQLQDGQKVMTGERNDSN